MHGRDLQQAVGRGLFACDVVGRHQQKTIAHALALQRDFGFFGSTAGENREVESSGQPIENPSRGSQRSRWIMP